MSNRQTPSNDEMEIAESKNPLADLLYDYTAQIMTTRAGNYMYHRIDACLSVVEKTAKWSLPQSPPPSEEDTSKMNISPPPLIRPLPWILFLPALIALSFLQSRRRKLRALKYRGQKIQRMKRAELDSEQGHEQATKTWLDRITFPLRYIICLRAVRPGTSTNQREHHHHRHHQQRQSRDANNDAANDGDESSRAKPRDETASRRKRNAHERDADDSGSSFDASVQELLDKYANDEGDSSYHMSDSASSETDSFISESDKSVTMDATEENDSKKAKKESNGHVTPPENKPVASQKPQHPKKRSSLNTASNDNSEEKPKSSATAETAAGNGNVDPKDEPKESQTEATQKPKKTTSDAKGNIDNNPAPQNNSAKADSSEDSTKHEIQNSKNPSPTATKDVKNNYQQRNTQQPHQKGQQNPHPQQQQTASVNGGGGGGKKHKRPHHQHSQQHQLQQQHQTQHQPQPQQQQY